MHPRAFTVGFLIIIVLTGIAVLVSFLAPNTAEILSFEECAKAGYPIMESYPRQCRADGTTFVEEIKTAAYDTPVSLRVGMGQEFTDLSVELLRIEDSRCKAGVQCIWAGELKGVFRVTVTDGQLTSEVFLGQLTQQSTDVGVYTISLVDITESTATISVAQ